MTNTKFFKRLMAIFICLAMICTMILPGATKEVKAKSLSDYEQITTVSLSGLSDINYVGYTVPKYNAAANIRIANSDSRYHIGNVYCYEDYDNTHLSTNEKLDAGVTYYLKVYLEPNSGYSFPAKIDDLSLTMDGAAVTLDADECSSYTTVDLDNARMVDVIIPFTTEGTVAEYIDNISLNVKDKPVYGATPKTDSEICELIGADDYSITHADWYYTAKNGGYAPSKSFTEGENFCLIIDLKENSDVERNLRFANDYHTTLNITGNQPKEGTYSISVYRNGSHTCKIYLCYSAEMPTIYKISYDPCGGTFPDGSTETATRNASVDGTVTTLWSEMTKDGYNFDGWYTAEEGGEKITGDTKFTSDTTIYAQYSPCVDAVEVSDIMLPVAGKAPVFTATLPEGAKYKIVNQFWEHSDGDSMQMYSSDIAQNNIIKQSYGEDYILTSFTSGNVYSYTITLQATDGMKFGKKTEVSVNGVTTTKVCYSDTLDITKTYECTAQGELKVYSGASIKSGICGTAIDALDLSNYVSSANTCSFSSTDNPSWITLSTDGKVTGTRPSTAQDATTFTVTVSDGDNSKDMIVTVGAVTTEWAIVTNPEYYTLSSCSDSAMFVVETTATSPTYKWYMKAPDNDTPVDLSSYASLLGLQFESNGGIMIISVKEGETTNLDGAQFYCTVTADSKTKTSTSATLAVNHKFTTCTPTSGSEASEHTYTCSNCGAISKESHNFHYELVTEATEGTSGSYKKVCEDCGKTITSSYSYGSSDTVGLTLNFNGADKPTTSTTRTVTKYSNVTPYDYNPSRNGYVFQGWALDADATEAIYGPDDKVFMADTTTLYAVWSPMQIVVCGTTVTLDNMDDVLGDGTVSFTPATTTHKERLILKGAKLTATYMAAIESYCAIYTSNPLEIVVKGDDSEINIPTQYSSSYGIYSTTDIKLSGSSVLNIKGDNVTYTSAVKASNIKVETDALYIQDAKCGFMGDTTFTGGNTYLSAGLYTGTDYKAINGNATIHANYNANITGTDTDEGEYAETTLSSGISLRYLAIEDKEAVKLTSIDTAEVTIVEPSNEESPSLTADAVENYSVTINGWYKKNATDTDSSAYPGTALETDETFADSCATSYVAKLTLTPNDGYQFSDIDDMTITVNGKEPISTELSDGVITLLVEMSCITTSHKSKKIDEIAATTTSEGVKEYYTCEDCGKCFTDEGCSEVIEDIETWKTGDGKIEKLTDAGDDSTKPSGDADTKASGDAGTKASGDAGSKASGDAGSKASGDAGSKASGDADTKASGDAGSKASGDADTKASGDAGTKASGDADTKASGDAGTKASGDADTKASGDADTKNSGTGTTTPSKPTSGTTKNVTTKVTYLTQKITTAKIKSYKAKKLKKKAASFKLKTKAKGKLTYKIIKGKKKYIKITKAGKVTLKKGCKKGTYKIKITAAATKKYKKATKVITIKVK